MKTQDLITVSIKTQIRRLAKDLRDTARLTPKEYCEREKVQDSTGYEYPVMLGALQAKVEYLLGWLEDVGLVDKD